MAFVSTYDPLPEQVSANETGPQMTPLQRLMLKLALQRKGMIHPNKADGFLTTGTHADSDSEGAGDATTSPGNTPGQQ